MGLLPAPMSRGAGLVEDYQLNTVDVLRKRTDPMSSSTVGMIIAVVIGGLVCVFIVVFYVLKWTRIKYANPKYLPGLWLKRVWRSWNPSSPNAKYSGSLQGPQSFEDLRATTTASSRSGVPSSTDVETANGPATEHEDGVDRHTSVRSIMTLPAYSHDARPTEKVIGREGERAGIDNVVEYPESESELEARREETMESLYQIRVARREEVADRAERRRLRREARARGDNAALAEMTRQSRLRAEASALPSPAEALIAEHQARGRHRRISSVSYAELGIARHDGSRVRANSHDSDNLPLLDSAASIGGTEGRLSTNNLHAHFRDRSNSSLDSRSPGLLTENEEEEDLESEQAATTAQGPRNTSSSLPTMTSLSQEFRPSIDSRTTAGSNDEARRLPQIAPPQYSPAAFSERSPQGEAPPYESPSTTGAPRLPGLAPMPSIEIIPNTPVTPSAETF